MRNVALKNTPHINSNNKTENKQAEKNIAKSSDIPNIEKKLKQARLPFKIISTPDDKTKVPEAEINQASALASGESESDVTEKRKRKLSYDSADDSKVGGNDAKIQRRSESKENLISEKQTTPIKETNDSQEENIIRDDDNDDDVIAVPSDKNDDETANVREVEGKVTKTLPKSNSMAQNKQIKSRKSGSKSTASSASSKVQFKLPLNSSKKKRRNKSILQSSFETSVENLRSDDESIEISDDDHIVQQQPQKRPKVNATNENDENQFPVDDKTCKLVVESAVITLDSDSDEYNSAKESKKSGDSLLECAKSTPKSLNRISSDQAEETANNSPKSKVTNENKVINPKSTLERFFNDFASNKTQRNSSADNDKGNLSQNEFLSDQSKENKDAEKTENNDSNSSESNVKNDNCAGRGSDSDAVSKKKQKLSKRTSAVVVMAEANTDKNLEGDLKKESAKNQCASNVTDSEVEEIETETATLSSLNHNGNSSTESGNSDCDAKGDKHTRAILHKSKLDDSRGEVIQKKALTPKQLKLREQRTKAREEKERRLQEERIKKQVAKEERELAKKREREEKEEQKRKERDERERKRLAELEAKNEEKRKRNEVKEEEMRKKEEERKRKDQEKEEAELKKKKAAEAFTKFFARAPQDQQIVKDTATSSNEEKPVLAFQPFQIKGAMKLAPVTRGNLNANSRSLLDVLFMESDEGQRNTSEMSDLYLQQLKTGLIKPGKWRRVSTESVLSKMYMDDDVIIIEDELEKAAQTIVEEAPEPIAHYRAKYLKFRENRRPPYRGTWRKKSIVIKPRRPFAQDKFFFDYEVDSDAEWEEEEPGESLDGSDDDKDKESEDDDYEVDNEWFVPHGHLSEEEMQNDDDGLVDANGREAQKVKMQLLQQDFVQEMKKKTEKIKPRLIGCVWLEADGSQPQNCPKIIWDTLNMRAILKPSVPPIVSEPSAPEKSDENGNNSPNRNNGPEKVGGPDKLKTIELSESLLKSLVHLIHGNGHSRQFLIKEFIEHIERNEESVRNGELRAPAKSMIREKIDEFATWEVTEDNSNDNANDKSGKKKKMKKRLCWIVNMKVLEKMGLTDLTLDNKWHYVLQSQSHKNKIQRKQGSTLSAEGLTSEHLTAEIKCHESEVNVRSNSDMTATDKIKAKRNLEITKFTKVLTPEQKSRALQKKTEETANVSNNNLNSKTEDNDEKTRTAHSPPAETKKSTTVAISAKKRVPLLMSVGRGQEIPVADKDFHVNNFLKQLSDKKNQLEKSEEPADVNAVQRLTDSAASKPAIEVINLD